LYCILHLESDTIYNCIVSNEKTTTHILWPCWTVFKKNWKIQKDTVLYFLYLAVFLTRYKNFDTFVWHLFFDTIQIQCIWRKSNRNTCVYHFCWHNIT
jgi:hypothetical protein